MSLDFIQETFVGLVLARLLTTMINRIYSLRSWLDLQADYINYFITRTCGCLFLFCKIFHKNNHLIFPIFASHIYHTKLFYFNCADASAQLLPNNNYYLK